MRQGDCIASAEAESSKAVAVATPSKRFRASVFVPVCVPHIFSYRGYLSVLPMQSVCTACTLTFAARSYINSVSCSHSGRVALTACTLTFAAECIAARGYYRLYILSEAERQPSLKATEVVDDLTEQVAQVRGCRVYLVLSGIAGSESNQTTPPSRWMS